MEPSPSTCWLMAQLVAHKPQTLDFAESAALPLISITAWEGLIDRARVQPHHNVLVHGAAGGVGHLAIQLAAIQGATVYATASTKDKGQMGETTRSQRNYLLPR